MALHPGEQGFCHKHEVYGEYCEACSKEKIMLAKNETYGGCGKQDFKNPKRLEILAEVDPFAAQRALAKEDIATTAFDKNTPSSLKQLRWAIYEVIDNYQGDYGKTIAGCLKQEVERLFKEYTDS